MSTADSRTNAADRRGMPDRRMGGDRRRNAEIKTPVIHLTPTALHVVIVVERTGGQSDLALFRSIPWTETPGALHTPEGQQQLTAALSKLAVEERLAGASCVLLLSSDQCVTRAVTGASDEVQRETSQLRERSQLYLSLGPGRKMIASSSTPLDARHSHALLTVATEQTLQALTRAVEVAGMEVAAIRAAQVALARALHYVDPAQSGADLVVSVDDTRVELGVMRGGRLFLDYRPAGAAKVEQLTDLLSQHHTRLKRYCQRHHGLERDTLSRIVICGPLKQSKLAFMQAAIIKELDVTILQIDPAKLPWEVRGGDFAPELAVAIGGALLLKEEPSQQGPNLMEELITVSRPPLARMLLTKLAPMAAALLIWMSVMVLNWSTNLRLTAMKTDLDHLTPQAARSTELRMKLLADKLETTHLEELSKLSLRQPYSLMLKNLTQSVPAEVWLGAVRFDGDQSATIAGSSYSESSIYDLVGNLQNLPGVGQVALQGTGLGRSRNRDSTTFDILLNFDFDGREERGEEEL